MPRLNLKQMATIKIEIQNCQQCPHFKRERYWTEDSWEEAYNWHCKASDNKKIAGYVEWNEAKDVKIPDWCPYS